MTGTAGAAGGNNRPRRERFGQGWPNRTIGAWRTPRIKIHNATLYSLGLKSDGTLWVKGSNQYGQLGLGEQDYARHWTQVMDHVRDMAAGYSFTLVLKEDGTLWGAGQSENGEIGEVAWHRPTFEKLMDEVMAIAAGNEHSLVLKEDGTLLGAGGNRFGQLGTHFNSTVPSWTVVAHHVKEVAAGYSFSLYLGVDGVVRGAGSHLNGETGDVTPSDTRTSNRWRPVLDKVEHIAAGLDHSLALRRDGSLWGAGGNDYSQLGLPEKTGIPEWHHLLDNVVAMTAYHFQSVAVTRDSKIMSAGVDALGSALSEDTQAAPKTHAAWTMIGELGLTTHSAAAASPEKQAAGSVLLKEADVSSFNDRLKDYRHRVDDTADPVSPRL